MNPASKSFFLRFIGLFLGPADARVYAAVRIAFASISLLNLIQIWPDREAFFTDAGMVSQEVVRHHTAGFYLSAFYFCTDLSSVSLYMIFSASAMLLLLLGAWPRMAAALVYVWHVSYAMRAPLVLAGWDDVLRCTSFVVLVSPMPRRWALSFRKLRQQATSTFPPRYGLTLLQLQLATVYIHAVLARLGSEFWISGEFLSFYLLSHNARWPGLWVLEYGPLLKGLTYMTLVLEMAIPILLITRRWRWYGFGAGFLLHASISLTSYNLNLFFLSMLMLYLSSLQSEDMDCFERHLCHQK